MTYNIQVIDLLLEYIGGTWPYYWLSSKTCREWIQGCKYLFFIICQMLILNTDWLIPGHTTFSNVAYLLKIPYWLDNIFQYCPLVMVLLLWDHIVLLWYHIVLLWCHIVLLFDRNVTLVLPSPSWKWPSFHMFLTAWYCCLVLSWYLMSY